jgi:hypothetical protein
MTHALIDADLVAFRCAATSEEVDEPIACWRAQRLVETILHDISADSYNLYLTGSGNFRKTISSDYKANRKGKPLPKHLQAIREFLTSNWDAEVTNGYEADDALGMGQNKDTIICSLDKDLLQIPGKHFNWVKQELTTIDEEQGIKNFYAQTLIGDRADNIIGVAGIGPVKTEKILSSVASDKYYQVCRELYKDDERYHLNCKLLWIWRTPNGTWEPPV